MVENVTALLCHTLECLLRKVPLNSYELGVSRVKDNNAPTWCILVRSAEGRRARFVPCRYPLGSASTSSVSPALYLELKTRCRYLLQDTGAT